MIRFLGNEEKRLSSVKVEAQEGALSLNDLEGSSQVLRVTHEGAVIEVPSIEGEARDFIPDLLYQRVER